MKTKLKILTVFLSSLITIIILEIGVRFYEFKFHKIPFSQSICDYGDDLFGWTGTMIVDEFESGKKRIFIVGDSFTEGNGIDKENIYYSVLKKKLDADFFIYAGLGYGTTQELLVMQNYIDLVRPDLIIFQITGNDIINNNQSLEKNSYLNNNRMLRPYYVDGKIKFLYPSSLGLTRYIIECKSRFFYRFFSKTDTVNRLLASKGMIKTTESSLENSIDFKDYKESLETTRQLVEHILSLSKGIPIIFLPANEGEDSFYLLFKNKTGNNVYWLDQPFINILKKVSMGENVLQEDGNHFNELGHKYFGEDLLKNLIEEKIVPELIQNI